jgi:hypothetical protein
VSTPAFLHMRPPAQCGIEPVSPVPHKTYPKWYAQSMARGYFSLSVWLILTERKYKVVGEED